MPVVMPTAPAGGGRRRVRRGWILPTLHGYRSSWLAADALAALTLVAVALPGQMATARLAGRTLVRPTCAGPVLGTVA
jgi:hypothetical protein